LVLRKVTTLVTMGWHGIGRVQGERFGGGLALSASPVPLSWKMRTARAGAVMDSSVMREGIAESIVRGAPTAPAARAKPYEHAGTDLLMALLSLQRVDGGFDLDDAMLARLAIKPADVAAAATGLPGDRKTVFRILHTVIVLEVLESRFADARETWFAAVRKSRTWLKQATDGWGRVVGGKTVGQWGKELAAGAAGSTKG
jgi:hypothetical protein